MPKRLLQSFIPWVIFFICFSYDENTLQIGASGALLALILLEKQGLKRGFVFDWGSLLFFIFIFVTVIVFYQPWVVGHASLLANGALTLIAWGSLFINKPFTMQYARLTVTQEYWETQLFKRLNRWLTLIWAIIFSVMTIVEYMQLNQLLHNRLLSDVMPVLLVILAVWITSWFPEWYKTQKIGQGGVINLNGLSDLYKITTDSAEISYRVIGHGPILLLLPAAQMTMYTWDVTLLQHLAKRFQVILPDYPGINASVMHSGEFTVSGLAKIFSEFIAALHVKSVTIVGYSMGGWIAQWMAIYYEQYVANVVLIASDAGGARVLPKSAALLEATMLKTTTEERYEIITEVLFTKKSLEILSPKLQSLVMSAGSLAVVPTAILKQQARLAHEWYQGVGCYMALSKIHQPTIVITGILDALIHRQNALVLANGISDSHLVEYATAGHGVIYQHPVEIALEISKLC